MGKIGEPAKSKEKGANLKKKKKKQSAKRKTLLAQYQEKDTGYWQGEYIEKNVTSQ